jgi:integral membrane protein
VKAALLRYRVLANIVGVLLIVLVLVGLPLHYGYLVAPGAMPKGGRAWQVGADISKYLGVAHGWLYMTFLVMAFWLSRKAKWDLAFTAVTLLCGTVPILSFWAEHRATRQVNRELARGGQPVADHGSSGAVAPR